MKWFSKSKTIDEKWAFIKSKYPEAEIRQYGNGQSIDFVVYDTSDEYDSYIVSSASSPKKVVNNAYNILKKLDRFK